MVVTSPRLAASSHSLPAGSSSATLSSSAAVAILWIYLRAGATRRTCFPWCNIAFWRKQCVEVRCVDGKRHACLYTNTHACPLRSHPRMDGPVVRWGVAVPPGQECVWPGGNRRFGVSSGYPKNSAKPPRARHASSEDTRAPGRRPAWRRARRGTNATCPSDATWQQTRLDHDLWPLHLQGHGHV